MRKILSAITLFLTFVCKVECNANEITVVDGEYIYFNITKEFCGWYICSGKRKGIRNDKIIKTNEMLLDLLKKHERTYGENTLKCVIRMLNIQILEKVHTRDIVRNYIIKHAMEHKHPEITGEIVDKLLNNPSKFSAQVNRQVELAENYRNNLNRP